MKKYKKFYDLIIKNKYIEKPNKYTSYASQGICSIDNSLYITSYDTRYDNNLVRDDKNNSILDIINYNDEYKRLYFDNKSHVGGIAYFNNKIYVSGYKCINIYDLDYINSLSNDSIIYNYTSYKLEDRDKIEYSSYLTTYNNKLYVGEFKVFNKSILNEYCIDNVNIILDNVYVMPFKKVQGLCICNYNNIDYYIFSCSFGRRFDSKIYICKLVSNKFIKLYSFLLPSMLEQICFDSDMNLVLIFESDCLKYSNKVSNVVDNICFLDIKSILNNL